MNASASVIDPAWVASFDQAAMNAHLVVLGVKGSGKTSFVRSRVSRDVFTGIGNMVICDGSDYQEAARRWAAPILRPGEDAGAMDPFTLGAPDTSGLMEEIEFISAVLMNLGGHHLHPTDHGEVSRVVSAFAKEHWAAASVGAKTEQSTASAMRQWFATQTDQLSGVLVGVLDRALEGPMGPHLGVPDAAAKMYGRRLTLVDLSTVEESVRTLVSLCWIFRAFRMASLHTRPHSCVLDPMDLGMMNEPFVTNQFMAMVKRARPRQFGLVIITDQVRDLLEAEGELISGVKTMPGLALLQNSSGKMIFRQAASDIPLVSRSFSLNEAESESLDKLGEGEGHYIDSRFRAAGKLGEHIRQFKTACW